MDVTDGKELFVFTRVCVHMCIRVHVTSVWGFLCGRVSTRVRVDVGDGG